MAERSEFNDFVAARAPALLFFVDRAELDRLGLRAGQKVPLTIRSVGRDTDQWRVFPIR